MTWRTIRLELAGTREFPAGSVSRGYLIRLPLNDRGAIDDAVLAKSPWIATVRRFWSSDPDENGRLVRVNGQLTLRCDGKPDRHVEPLSFDEGQLVNVIDDDGRGLPFRVASILSVGESR